MTRRLSFRHVYPTDPDRLFELATDLDTLEAVTRPCMRFHHLPSGQVQEGQVIDVDVSPFVILPAQPYKMVITKCSAQDRVMISRETGMGWHLVHRLDVSAIPNGSELLDRIEVTGGMMSLLLILWLRFTHHARYRKRLALLKARPGAQG